MAGGDCDFLKLTLSIVYIITIQSLVKTKFIIQVFRSFISMLYKVHKIHAVMYRCIILVINSAIRELYFAITCTIHIFYEKPFEKTNNF